MNAVREFYALIFKPQEAIMGEKLSLTQVLSQHIFTY